MDDPTQPPVRLCSACDGELAPADNGSAYRYCPHCDRQHLRLAIHCDRCRRARVKASDSPS